MKFNIDPDIKKAETLPSSFYKDKALFNALKDKIFKKSWQFVGEDNILPEAETIYPFEPLDGYLQEPLLFTKDKNGKIKCLSNVCTHRANIVAKTPRKAKSIVCGYHGRKFELNGNFKSMPEFETAENFPRPCDSLKVFPIRNWGKFLFISLDPSFDLDDILSVISERVGFLPLDDFKHEPGSSKDYVIHGHWALYCDNYLEGFHIPFVHKDLNAVLDYSNYTTLLYDHCNLQIGYANEGEEIFDLPISHMDYGKKIAAYYYWIFPNMMFNFYPWGLSINIVKPVALNKTTVSFLTYTYDETKLNSGAGASLDQVEREDEIVVEDVHKGLRSSAYTTGRFSPTRERGVHHFHRLLADFCNHHEN